MNSTLSIMEGFNALISHNWLEALLKHDFSTKIT